MGGGWGSLGKGGGGIKGREEVGRWPGSVGGGRRRVNEGGGKGGG